MAEHHTPTPWTLQDNHLGTYRITAMQGPIKVCPCYSSSLDDAAFIVRAVNAHDELVAALNVLLDEAESFSVSGVYFSEPCMGHKGPNLARAALAKAEA